ncbi:MAG: outer membrane protein assembly factor BamD, partial [Lysobacter sp.]
MTHRSAPLPFARTFIVLLTLVLFASGCARMSKMFKDEDANEGVPVEELYDKAHTSMTRGNWANAETTFK